ncbi:hypothetical protein KAS08_05320 [Candidatus Pacearchaeota archaeon]|nr:hypothetical protein [Candidatus Pacearchaeota archaeon]
MEHFDVIIIGAGIAGVGLAYHLNKICPEKKTLIIDKEDIAFNEGYGSRITYSETINKYNLPYKHIFDGMKIGNKKGVYLTVDAPFFAIDYKEVCASLLNRSSLILKKEKAIRIFRDILETNKNKYHFKFLVDCSGHNAFLNKFIKRKNPLFYWIGNTNICEGKSILKENYFYLLAEDNGFIEDIYVTSDQISLGHWTYTKKIDFNCIKYPKQKFSSKVLNNLSFIKQSRVVVPGTPILPLTKKNFAFLGDSMGNVIPTVGEGVRPILESSELLARAIKKNNLKLFDKEWKRIYLSRYLKVISGKIDIKDRLAIGYMLVKNPEIFLKMIKLEKFKFPEEVSKKIPIKWKKEILKRFILLRFKFFIMDPFLSFRI